MQAAGLPDLVAGSAEEYFDMAVGLARAPKLLLDLRERLAAAHTSAPLFDAAKFAADLERAFVHMDVLRARGLAPRGFEVDTV